MKLLVLFLLFAVNSYALNTTSLKEKYQNDYTVEEPNRFYPFNYFELSTDNFFDRVNSKSSLYTNSSLLLDLNFNEYFTVHTKFGLEKIKGTSFTPNDLRSGTVYGNEGLIYGHSLTAQELSLLFKFYKAQFQLGKINPMFGAGSERDNDFFYSRWYGTSGTFLNQGYALNEKIGILTNISVFETEVSKVNLQASLFTNDSSDLYSKPFLVERTKGNDITNDRRAGSEKMPKSHAISLQGIFVLRNDDTIAFNVGYKGQFSKFDNVSEKGLSLGTQYVKYLTRELSIGAFAEYTQIWNAYAFDDFSEKYGTISLYASFNGFTLGALTNLYHSDHKNNSDKITYREYFTGFQVPKSELSIFLSIRQYRLPQSKPYGFGVNIKYKIK